LNLYVKQRIKHGFIVRKTAGKIAIFFAQRAGAPKFTVYRIKDTDVNGVVISFMTLPADGLISYYIPPAIAPLSTSLGVA
jgi:hypothetical protein